MRLLVKHFILKPAIDLAGKMKYAKGYYDSMYGRIESGWEIENEIIRYTFNIMAILPLYYIYLLHL